MLLLFSWTPVHDVCPNYEVLMFQPWIRTRSDLGCFDNCCVAIIINPILPSPPVTRFPPGGGYLLMPHPSLPFSLSCLHSVPEYRVLFLPASYYDSFTSLSPPPLPHLKLFQRRAPSVSKISFNIAPICFRADFFRHHVSWRLPPP